MIRIKKGLNLPILGAPEKRTTQAVQPKTVALLGGDYIGMKPTMLVQVGDRVKKGQILFIDKKCPDIKFSSPGGGKVIEINRGEKRVFQSIVIELDEREEEVTFEHFSENELNQLTEEKVIRQLIESGLWTSFRTRPFSIIPHPTNRPSAIFVNGMDTNPLAIDPQEIIQENKKSFENGLKVIARIGKGEHFLCVQESNTLDFSAVPNFRVERFSGPHPAGNTGVHIHKLHPVNAHKVVWHLNYADVIAIGELFTTGKINNNITLALGGNQVKDPRYLQTRRGANLENVLRDELKDGENRIVSGSILNGHHATGPFQYLGRYHTQVGVIREARERRFLGWLGLGKNIFSIKRIYGFIFAPKKYEFHTNSNGGKRAMVPIGSYEKVMPFDMMPTFLLRALITKDTDRAQEMGCLELDEEDVALCTFVCPSKYDFGKILKRKLNAN